MAQRRSSRWLALSLFPLDWLTEQPGQNYSPMTNQNDSADQMGDRNDGFLPRFRTGCPSL